VARLVDGAGKRRPRPVGAALREGCCPSPISVQATWTGGWGSKPCTSS